MSSLTTAIIGLGAFAAGSWAARRPKPAAQPRGPRPGETVIGFSPGDHGAEADKIALARALASTATDPTEQQAVAWVARNRAAILGVTVRELLIPAGEYGPQGSAGGREFLSTAQEPSALALAVAAAVLGADPLTDPTRGAVDFWRPSRQDRFRLLGDAHRVTGDARLAGYGGYTAGEREMREAFEKQGLRVVGVVGEIELLG